MQKTSSALWMVTSAISISTGIIPQIMVVIILFRIFTIRLPDMITNGVQIDFPDKGVKFGLGI
jgi:hypothetical protein